MEVTIFYSLQPNPVVLKEIISVKQVADNFVFYGKGWDFTAPKQNLIGFKKVLSAVKKEEQEEEQEEEKQLKLEI